MNLRDLRVPKRQYRPVETIGTKALMKCSRLLLEAVETMQHTEAGTKLSDPETLAEAQALINLEAEMWERANWTPEGPITKDNEVPG